MHLSGLRNPPAAISLKHQNAIIDEQHRNGLEKKGFFQNFIIFSFQVTINNCHYV